MGAIPFRRALLWISEVAFRDAVSSSRPHICASLTMPASWEPIIDACATGSPDSQSSCMMRRYLNVEI